MNYELQTPPQKMTLKLQKQFTKFQIQLRSVCRNPFLPHLI
jgi:hypothetical protein